MQDPVQRHPTRAEQLDILASVIADHADQGGAVLDLGCGTGYVAKLILDARPDLALTGIDMKAEALAEARANLGEHDINTNWMEGDLRAIESIPVGEGVFDVVVSALTFHDLDDDAKRRAVAWAAARLVPSGVFLLYDRLRLTEPRLFPLQQSIWQRIERTHGVAMRTADDFASYEADLGADNRPGALADYMDWFAAAGLGFQCLHVHGNVALMAGARGAGA